MGNRALVVIDLQNDITKNYRDIIDSVNAAVAWALNKEMRIVYIKHNNLSGKTRTFKPGTKGEELVPELSVVSEYVFTKSKASALTCDGFASFLESNAIEEVFVAGADATACVKSTSYNLAKAGYHVCVLSDCVTSYDKGKIPEMLTYYASKGCAVKELAEVIALG